jgi:hypothetical protein
MQCLPGMNGSKHGVDQPTICPRIVVLSGGPSARFILFTKPESDIVLAEYASCEEIKFCVYLEGEIIYLARNCLSYMRFYELLNN